VRTGRGFPIIVIQEAGLDGFWIHRVLEAEGIVSHVVGAASILTSRRRRRAKTDRIDGETLLCTLMAYKRGDPRVANGTNTPAAASMELRCTSWPRTLTSCPLAASAVVSARIGGRLPPPSQVAIRSRTLVPPAQSYD
jgi:transposase